VAMSHVIALLASYADMVEDREAGCVPLEGSIKRVSQDGKHTAEWDRPGGVHIKATWKDKE
jgi:hypothetical protein